MTFPSMMGLRTPEIGQRSVAPRAFDLQWREYLHPNERVR
jgi:hypothetical protein